MNILLDFDGVLFDSSWEVTAIILLTYINSFPNSNISKHFAKLKTSKVLHSIGKYAADHAFRVFEVETKNLNRYFRKFRTYCIDVDDFFIISYLIDNNYFDLKSLNYKNVNDNFYYAYKKRVVEEKSDDLKLFIQSFYDSRRYIKDMNEEFWILLNQPFEKEVRIFMEVYKRYNVGILSTKQKYAIISILHYYGIPIDPNVVFAKENDFIHKGKKIKEIINLWGIVERDLHFVDDLIENLLKIRNYAKGVNLYMSSWGYNNFAHRSLAKKNGIKIIDSIDYLIRKGE